MGHLMHGRLRAPPRDGQDDAARRRPQGRRLPRHASSRNPTPRAGAARHLPVALHGARRAVPRDAASRATSTWPAGCSTCATSSKDGDDDNQDRIPFRKQTHGRSATPSARTTSTPAPPTSTPRPATRRCSRRCSRSGTTSSRASSTSPAGAARCSTARRPTASNDQTTITRVHQAFGRDYQLPQRDRPQRNVRRDRQPAVELADAPDHRRGAVRRPDRADALQQRAGRRRASTARRSSTPTRCGSSTRCRSTLRWSRHAAAVHRACFCCPPNVVRTIAQSATYAYATSDARRLRRAVRRQLETTLDDGTRRS